MKGVRKIVSAVLHADAPPETVFPLLCPVRETEWIENWRYELVYSHSDYAEQDCVFTTDLPDEGPDTWVVSRYDPPELIEFVRINPDRAIRYTICLTGADGERSTWEWRQVITGLNEEGNRRVEQSTAHAFQQKVESLERMLNHFLKTGERLRLEHF